jgi:hypothetical protein
MPPFCTLPRTLQEGRSSLQALFGSRLYTSSHFKPLPVDPLLNFSILTHQLLKSGQKWWPVPMRGFTVKKWWKGLKD